MSDTILDTGKLQSEKINVLPSKIFTLLIGGRVEQSIADIPFHI